MSGLCVHTGRRHVLCGEHGECVWVVCVGVGVCVCVFKSTTSCTSSLTTDGTLRSADILGKVILHI